MKLNLNPRDVQVTRYGVPGIEICRAREALGWSQAELAARLSRATGEIWYQRKVARLEQMEVVTDLQVIEMLGVEL